MDTTPKVAANLRRLRQAKGWSLAQLSRRLDEVGHPLSVPMLSKMELGAEPGRPKSLTRGIDLDDLTALAEALEVTPAVLLADPSMADKEEAIEWLSERLTQLTLALQDAEEAAQVAEVAAARRQYADAHVEAVKAEIRAAVDKDAELAEQLRLASGSNYSLLFDEPKPQRRRRRGKG